MKLERCFLNDVPAEFSHHVIKALRQLPEKTVKGEDYLSVALGSDDKRTELLLPQIKLEEGTGLAQDNFRAETYKPNLPSLAQDLEPRDLSNIYELPSPAAAQETVETRVMRTMLGEKVSSEFFDPVADVLKLFIPYIYK